ncbi:hypothetical protein GTP41_04205 [Pseudoduganella sp. DS3]|uniref:Regulator of ribonuclease activity B domain-containing protein n=1 Tax=Pseudoduganella guangdongensis TaxID=2692179 RepID=A0A6N9HCN6_9BURK|nr:ribonuclease E inhibitor RraB [Pseudoduganella guangdongensis]MYN01298.1 hypothetical protein [Pseudoduganella guangdongensis]
MSSKIEIGNIVFEVPEGSSASHSRNSGPEASKPETPEPLEETPYIYRPNDAFQSAVDEARAIASITSGHKPWVLKTWFVLFVIGPLVYAQLFALALAQHKYGWDWMRTVAGANLFILPIWSIYYGIWRRRVKKAKSNRRLFLVLALVGLCGGLFIFGSYARSVPEPAYTDAALVQQLRRAGSDLTQAHGINFYLYFPSESGARWAAGRLGEMGFGISLAAAEGGIPQWQLTASRRMVPNPEELANLRAYFGDLCSSQGGAYDGWDTEVVRAGMH